ncbi:MAG: hypothetical protein FWD74_07520 [Actinomycetia bacterium]|nr:hypothetical protein [Actinomycetes bacterium]
MTIDEAWAFDALTGQRLEAALRPATATRKARQLWIVSAGGTSASEWLLSWRELGRALTGPDQGIAYWEWYPEVDAAGNITADLDDPEVWAATHPAIGYHLDIEALIEDRKTMRKEGGSALFYRAYLDVFSDATGDRLIPRRAWDSCQNEDWELAPGPGLRLGCDVASDQAAGAVALAARNGARVGIELVDHRPGIGWMAARVRELRDRYRCTIHADRAGPAGPVIRALEDAGLTCPAWSVRDHVIAAAGFRDAILTGAVVTRPQPALNTAAGAVQRRDIADGWVYSRRRSPADVSPFIAAMLAWDAASRLVPRPPTIVTA